MQNVITIGPHLEQDMVSYGMHKCPSTRPPLPGGGGGGGGGEVGGWEVGQGHVTCFEPLKVP